MGKKIILSFVALLLIAGGVFYWWQEQKDVRELNKGLPEGIRVVKSLVGQEYKVVNKIDGYEFKVPKEWEGVSEIIYTPERTESGYTGTSISIEGKEGPGRVIAIDNYKSGGDMSGELKLWAEVNFQTFGLVGDFNKDSVGKFEIVRTQENIHFGGEYVYFFKKNNNKVYGVTGPSEEFIKYIVSNGKW